jgi:hypothetical protein
MSGRDCVDAWISLVIWRLIHLSLGAIFVRHETAFKLGTEVTLIRYVDLQCCQMNGVYLGDRPEHDYNA